MKTTFSRSAITAILTGAALSAFVACGNDGGSDEQRSEAKITVNPTSLILEAEDESATFKLSCDRAWSITTNDAWITAINPSSDTEGAADLVITITTTVNDGELRPGKLLIECGGKPREVPVSQASGGNAAVLGQTFLMKATLVEDEMGFNLLSDPGFEDYGDQTIDYKSPWWILASKRSPDAHTGHFSAQQNFVEPENLGFQTFAARPGTDYEITAWFKSNMAAENPDIYMGIRKSIEGRPVLIDVNKGPGISNSWKMETVAFNTAECPLLEAFAFEFTKDGCSIAWDDICVKRPNDSQKSYKLSDIRKIGSICDGLNGAITSADGCTAWNAGNGKTMLAFGQNIGSGEVRTRSNALAVSTDTNLDDGITASFPGEGGKASEIVAPAGGSETAVVPTAGVHIGARQWIHYMSVRDKQFAEDLWTVNHSGLVYSDDNGATWNRSDVKWDAAGDFVQVAFLHDNGYVYMYGSSVGRIREGEQFVKLARAAESDMQTQSGWKYWNGSTWAANASDAVPLVYAGTLGELSVIKNTTTGRYLMIYSSIKRGAVVIRDAAAPEGDWSGEKIVLTDTEGEVLSAPSFLPVSAEGNTIYFLISSAWGK